MSTDIAKARCRTNESSARIGRMTGIKATEVGVSVGIIIIGDIAFCDGLTREIVCAILQEPSKCAYINGIVDHIHWHPVMHI
jgi:hypothetical protein